MRGSSQGECYTFVAQPEALVRHCPSQTERPMLFDPDARKKAWAGDAGRLALVPGA